jgi:hypothetical protein
MIACENGEKMIKYEEYSYYNEGDSFDEAVKKANSGSHVDINKILAFYRFQDKNDYERLRYWSDIGFKYKNYDAWVFLADGQMRDQNVGCSEAQKTAKLYMDKMRSDGVVEQSPAIDEFQADFQKRCGKKY